MKNGGKVLKRLVKLLSFMLLLVMAFGVTEASAVSEDFPVKVKLVRDLGAQNIYYFEPKGDSLLKEDTKVVLTKDKKYKIEIIDKKMTIKDGSTIVAKDLATVTIEPKIYNKENFVLLYRGDKATEKHPYMGTVLFRLEGTTPKIQPVNQLFSEEYLKGVLPGEMPAAWGSAGNGGMEALKAQAIAARSYLFGKTKGNIAVEINDTTSYQVFKGFIWDQLSPEYAINYQYTNQAVDQTAGQIMTYKLSTGKDGIVAGFFSSSNGGQTELPQQYWSSNLPYIAKSKPDPFDKTNVLWNITWLKQQLNPSLDVSAPGSWWDKTGEYGLSTANVPKANDVAAFTQFKKYVLAELKKQDPTVESIKIASIDSMEKKDYTNTFKVERISTNFSYYTRHKNGTALSYDMLAGAQSETLSGDTRYDTAVKIAREYVGAGKAAAIVLGRGDIPADALAGTVLAHKESAPIMLVRNNAIPASVDQFIKEKVQPNAKIYLLGGEGAISAELENNLISRGFDIQRIAGNDRTGTSIAIANEVNSPGKEVIIASGNNNSSDALSASAYAAAKQVPIIIQFGTKTAAQTRDYLKAAGITKTTLIGGPVVISDTVEKELLAAGHSPLRIQGETRVETSLAVNRELPLNGTNIVIGNAHSFVDALAGSVLAAKTGSPIVLLHPDAAKLPHAFFGSLPVKSQAYFLGGPTVVSEDLKISVNEYIQSELKKKKMTLTFEGADKNKYPKTMESFRMMLGAGVLRSVDFDLVNEKDRIIMDGSGFGHGIGMSQYGALRRAQATHSAQDILTFYYDGIEIKPFNQINN